MRIDVIDRGNAYGADRITAKYNKDSEITMIDVDCDVLTLGITATVLDKKYDDYLSTLDEDTAMRVQIAVAEACKNEEY